jgi:hypothetical protein
MRQRVASDDTFPDHDVKEDVTRFREGVDAGCPA